MPPITATIRMKTPSSGPTILLQRVAKQIDHEQQHRQLRQRQEQIGQPHQRRVDAAARDSGDRADERADDDRHQHRGEPDRERDAAAIQHAREQILAEIVGAERMRPGRTGELRTEVDVVDRHLPNERAERHREHHQRQDPAPATASRCRRNRRQVSRAERGVPRSAAGAADPQR